MGRGKVQRLIDGVRGRLSWQAAAIFEELDIPRDPAWTVDEPTLRALLAARGLPASGPVLAIERLAGGAELREGVHLGVFASLWREEGVRPDVESAPRAARKDRGPVPFIVHRLGESWWHAAAVDERGVIHLRMDDDDFGYTSPAFDTFTQYLEVYAMLRESITWPPLDERVPWHRIRVDARVGPELAAALGAEPFEPGSGTWCAAWRGEDVDVVAMDVEGFPRDVRIGTPDEARAAEVVRAALSLSGDVAWWSAGPRPRRDPRVPSPARRAHEHGRDVQVWGAPRAFTFDDLRAHRERLHPRR